MIRLNNKVKKLDFDKDIFTIGRCDVGEYKIFCMEIYTSKISKK